jgi:hypothetical protein
LVLIAPETNLTKSTTDADKEAAEGASLNTRKKRKPRSRAA